MSGLREDSTQADAIAFSQLNAARQRQRMSWQNGQPEPVECLLADFPGLAAEKEAVLDLIRMEIVLREQRGESPGLDEYLARFVALEEALTALFVGRTAWAVSGPEPINGVATTPYLKLSAPLPVVPGYEVLGELGGGGMGMVYRARHLALNRLVALKMVRNAELATPDEQARFLREAEAAARLKHPNVVPIYEIGEHAGKPYFAMELVEGVTLAASLAGTPLPARAAAELGRTLAAAIHHAHMQGIVHRDLKPSNVMLSNPSPAALPEAERRASPAGRGEGALPKIADFGLAKHLDREDLTATEAVLGTPSYMAPEQAAGHSRDVGPAADVYALGAILYECLTGRPPFRGETPMDTVLQVINDEPVPARRLNPRVHADLDTIILKCLQKIPDRRYDTAEALGDDLGRYLDGLPVLARPAGAIERAGKWSRRHPAAAAVAGVSVTAGVALLVLGLIYDTRLAIRSREVEGLRGELVGERETAREATATAKRSTAATEEALYRARFSAGWQAYQAANIPRAREHLDLAPVAQRHWEWDLLRHLCLADAGALDAHGESVQAVAWAPDGKVLASGAGEPGRTDSTAELQLRDFTNGVRLYSLVGHKGAVTGVAFSPDGLTLASASLRTPLRALIAGAPLAVMNRLDGEVILWDVKTRRKREQIEGYGTVAFSKDGKLLAWVGLDNAVRIRSAGGGSIRKLQAQEGLVGYLGFAPNGQIVSANERMWREGTTVRFRSYIRSFDVGADRQLWGVELDGEEVNALAFHPTGRRLALTGLNGRIRILDAATGGERRVLPGHKEAALTLAWSPDGSLLASGSKDRTIRLWDGESGRELAVLRGHAGSVCSLAFKAGEPAGGWRLASGDNTGTIKFWDASGPGYQALHGHTSLVRHCAFSPDGTILATAGADGTVRLWDTHTGKVSRVLECQAEKVAFSPDSSTLATAEGNALQPSEPGRVRLWPVAGGKPRLLYADAKHPVLGVAFSPDGAHLALVSGALHTPPAQAGKALVLAVADGRTEGECQGELGVAVAVAYRPDGQELALAGWNGRLQTFPPKGGKALRGFGKENQAPITAVAYGRDGLLAFADNTGILWLADQTANPPRRIRAAGGSIYALAFQAGGERLAVAGLSLPTGQGEVRILDVASGDEMLELPGMLTAAFSPDGRTLAAPWAENLTVSPEVRLWRTPVVRQRYAIRTEEGTIYTLAAGPDGELWSAHQAGFLHKWRGVDGTPQSGVRRNEREVSALALTADGKLLASVDDTGTILVGHASEAGTPRPLVGHKGLVFGMAFDKEGKRLVSAGRDDFTVRIWNTETDKEQGCLREHKEKVWRAAFSPDGRRVASVDLSGRLIVSDVEKQSIAWEAQAHPIAANALAFRPDGKQLATGGGDGLVRIWDADSGKLLRTLRGHGASVVVVAYRPDSAVLASAGHDQTVRLWNADNGESLLVLRGHENTLHALTFAPDGKTLYSGGKDQRIAAWDVTGIR
jgi:WD40 repeat protein/tRNA A-37 threonylcarbamoyl transferase component Bud32